MLGFFRGAAKVFFFIFFGIAMIGSLIAGVNSHSPWGVLIILGGFIASIFLFSFLGTFLAMAEDIAEIRKLATKMVNMKSNRKNSAPKTIETDNINDVATKTNYYNDK